jgi:hypothetical protein
MTLPQLSSKRLFKVGFDVLTAVVMTSAGFQVVTPCISKRIQRFGETNRFHLQGLEVSQARNLQKQIVNHDVKLDGVTTQKNATLISQT